jgi:co-chaperonin GroES (HSP10)
MTETKKGIILPDSAIGMPTWAVVAAVPNDGECPVEVGDRVVFREGAGTPVSFQDRKDLILLQYTDEADSEIMGLFPSELTYENNS